MAAMFQERWAGRTCCCVAILVSLIAGCGEDEEPVDPNRQWSGTWLVISVNGVSVTDDLESQLEDAGIQANASLSIRFRSSAVTYELRFQLVLQSLLVGHERIELPRGVLVAVVQTGAYVVTEDSYRLVPGKTEVVVSESLELLGFDKEELGLEDSYEFGSAPNIGTWSLQGKQLLLIETDGGILNLLKATVNPVQALSRPQLPLPDLDGTWRLEEVFAYDPGTDPAIANPLLFSRTGDIEGGVTGELGIEGERYSLGLRGFSENSRLALFGHEGSLDYPLTARLALLDGIEAEVSADWFGGPQELLSVEFTPNQPQKAGETPHARFHPESGHLFLSWEYSAHRSTWRWFTAGIRDSTRIQTRWSRGAQMP